MNYYCVIVQYAIISFQSTHGRNLFAVSTIPGSFESSSNYLLIIMSCYRWWCWRMLPRWKINPNNIFLALLQVCHTFCFYSFDLCCSCSSWRVYYSWSLLCKRLPLLLWCYFLRNYLGLDALVDTDAIFCYQCVRKMNESAHVVVEIVRHTNVGYLDPESGLNSSDIDYKFTPQFASGALFATSLLDTLVCQVSFHYLHFWFFNWVYFFA